MDDLNVLLPADTVKRVSTIRVAGAPAQTISAQQAAGLVRSGMWLDYGVSLCQPDVFDAALAAR